MQIVTCGVTIVHICVVASVLIAGSVHRALSNNPLGGSIPESFGNLMNLQELYVSHLSYHHTSITFVCGVVLYLCWPHFWIIV